jgi:hypothetical protein
MKNLKLTKARISKLQEAAIKVSGFIDTLNLTSDERTDLYAALLYAHVKNAQHNIGELPGLECVLERFSLMVSKLLLTNTKVISNDERRRRTGGADARPSLQRKRSSEEDWMKVETPRSQL